MSVVARRRLPVVGVMGSGSREHADLAEPLGRWLAERGVHLLTGGGPGVMEAVSRSFHGVDGRRGLVLGVLPAIDDGPDPPPGYPNPWVEVEIRTHLPARGARGSDPDSRNHVNVLSSDVVVALPGGAGTASEVALAGRYGRPVVVWRPGDRRADAADAPAVSVGAPGHRGPAVAATLAEIIEFLEEVLQR